MNLDLPRTLGEFRRINLALACQGQEIEKGVT